jgi:hypothetical protein
MGSRKLYREKWFIALYKEACMPHLIVMRENVHGKKNHLKGLLVHAGMMGNVSA